MNVTKGNVMSVVSEATALLQLGDEMESINLNTKTTPTTVPQTHVQDETQVESNHMDSSAVKKVATELIRNWLLALSKHIHDLAEDTYAKRDVIARMRCDMPDVSFYLNDSSDHHISIGASDYEESEGKSSDTPKKNQALAQISKLL